MPLGLRNDLAIGLVLTHVHGDINEPGVILVLVLPAGAGGGTITLGPILVLAHGLVPTTERGGNIAAAGVVVAVEVDTVPHVVR